MSQYLYNLSFRFSVILTVICYLTYYLMPRYCSFRTFCRYKNISTYFLVIGNYKTIILIAFVKCTNNLLHASGYDFHNLSFLSLSMLNRQERNFDCILMKGSVNTVLRYIEVIFSALYFYKAKALGMTDKSSHQSLRCMFCFYEFAFFSNTDLALIQKFIQDTIQFTSVFLGYLQHNCKLLFFHRNIEFFPHQIKYYFLTLVILFHMLAPFAWL